MTSLLEIVLMLIHLAKWIVLAHVIMSWLINFNVLNLRQPLVWQIWNGLNRILEPVYTRVRRFVPGMGGIDFAPLIVAYLTDGTDAEEMARGHAEGVFTAAKLYPAHATTGSAHGVTDIAKIMPVLKRMADEAVAWSNTDKAAKLRETFAIPNKPKNLAGTRKDWEGEVPVWIKLAVDLGIKLD